MELRNVQLEGGSTWFSRSIDWIA